MYLSREHSGFIEVRTVASIVHVVAMHASLFLSPRLYLRIYLFIYLSQSLSKRVGIDCSFSFMIQIVRDRDRDRSPQCQYSLFTGHSLCVSIKYSSSCRVSNRAVYRRKQNCTVEKVKSREHTRKHRWTVTQELWLFLFCVTNGRCTSRKGSVTMAAQHWYCVRIWEPDYDWQSHAHSWHSVIMLL